MFPEHSILVSSRAPLHRVGFVVIALVACASCGGGGGGGDGSSASSGSGGTPSTPTGELDVSGTPLQRLAAGTQYCFSPNVAYTGDSEVRFSVSNLPPWADYDPVTGEVTGLPDVADVGLYEDIEIAVSDGIEQEMLGPFTIEVVAFAPGTAELAWAAPMEHTDGTPLTDLAGYTLYWGPGGDSLCNSVTIANPSIDTFLIEGLTPAAWHFAATAFDSSGVESGLSNSVSKTITE